MDGAAGGAVAAGRAAGTATGPAAPDLRGGTLAGWWRSPHRWAAATVLLQALVYGSLAWAGYFYVDDLDDLATAARAGLGPGYLTLRLNDHLAPGLRLSYWLLAHLAPYDHGVSVLARVAVQATASLLFYRLLLRLFGTRPVSYVALAAYAFCPLTLPSFLSLSSAVNLLPAHVAVILLLDGHVRYAATGRLRYAGYGALALLGGLLFWEKIALAAALPPLLTVAVLAGGGLRGRLRALRRQLAGLALYALPLLAFFGWYFAAGYPTSDRGTSLGTVLSIARDGWFRAVGPAVVGGPWSWYTGTDVYFGVAAPPPAAVLLGQAALAGLAVLGVRRRGWVSLACWSMPLAYLLADAVVLAVGRYPVYGSLVATNFHYLSDLTVPLVLAGAGALVPVRLDEVRARSVEPVFRRPEVPAVPAGGAGHPGRGRPWFALVAVGCAVSVAFSAAAFERRWTQNPTRAYLTTLLADLRARPGTNLWDAPLSPRVLPVIAVNRRPSQVLAPLDAPVTFDDPSVPLRTVDERGRVVDAGFVAAAASREEPRAFCSHLARGAGVLTVPLDRTAPAGDYVVVVDYLLERGSLVTLRLGDGHRLADPLGGASRDLRAGLRRVILESSGTAVDRLVVGSGNDELNLCVGHVQVGAPFAVSGQ